jgi:hypothetical protein
MILQNHGAKGLLGWLGYLELVSVCDSGEITGAKHQEG